ncbi:MAG: sulfite exporter TauE/SafE family protein [Candidatus Gottesmanbacteria bacterium]
MTIVLLILIITIGCEFIDSYLGMMYGTILSPVLIIAGYDPKLVIPSILISQAVGGAIASWRHNKLKNALIFKKDSEDFKITLLIASLGIVATLIGAFIGASMISRIWLKNYIGILCLIMGGSVLLKISFSFSWGKMVILSIISAFNKAVSGGGYGPLMSTGQIVVGRESKNSIVVTDFAEVPICLASFAVWVWINKWPNSPLIYILPIGAAIGGYLGPMALKKSKSKEKIARIVGALAFILGIAILFFEVKG